MKKFILNFILLPVLLFVLFNVAVLAILGWTGTSIESGIEKNIEIVKEKYPGKAEDALIAYLLDTSNSPDRRTHVAIWTLGQIKSQKALPYLKELYRDDPYGHSCKGRHDSVLCQSGLYKAINAIESDWKMHPEFNK